MYLGFRDKSMRDGRTRFPAATVTREFKGGVINPQNLIKPLENLCEDAWDAGMVCAVSFKFNPDSVFDSAWRPHIEQLAWYLKNNGLTEQTVIIIWHEPENDTTDSFRSKNKTFRNAAQYVKYFNTVRGWLKNIDPSIVTSHAALGYAYRPTRGGKHDNTAYVTNPTDWVTDADIHSVDLYSGRSFPLGDHLGHSAPFKRWAESRPVGSAWAVSERGWAATPDQSAERAASIAAEFVWLATLPEDARPKYYVVWNTPGTENDESLLLDSAAIDAINTGYANLTAPPAPETPEKTDCPLCLGTGKIDKGGTYTVIKER